MAVPYFRPHNKLVFSRTGENAARDRDEQSLPFRIFSRSPNNRPTVGLAFMQAKTLQSLKPSRLCHCAPGDSPLLATLKEHMFDCWPGDPLAGTLLYLPAVLQSAHQRPYGSLASLSIPVPSIHDRRLCDITLATPATLIPLDPSLWIHPSGSIPLDPSLWIRPPVYSPLDPPHPIPGLLAGIGFPSLASNGCLVRALAPQSPALDLAFLLCSRTMAATSESRYEPSEVVLSGYMAKTAHVGVESSVNGAARGLSGCSDGS